jgi:membrane-bound lytic murein transglycosylase F
VSRLKRKARSPDGAIGIRQMLPATFKAVRRRHPHIANDPWAPQWNIAAAIAYNRELWAAWQAERPRAERLKFMFGAYNAGLETVLQAQQKTMDNNLDPFVWQSIAQVLPEMIGSASRETIEYGEAILAICCDLAPLQSTGGCAERPPIRVQLCGDG